MSKSLDERTITDRTDRTLETREATARTETWKPPSLLPMPDSRPGIVFRWVRKSLLGDVDPTNVSSRRREGWEPVKACDVPELTLSFNESASGDLVEVGGLILCRMSAELNRQRAEYYDKLNRLQMKSVDENFKSGAGPLPTFSENETEVKLGRRRVEFGDGR